MVNETYFYSAFRVFVSPQSVLQFKHMNPEADADIQGAACSDTLTLRHTHTHTLTCGVISCPRIHPPAEKKKNFTPKSGHFCVKQ